ncbi:hypothetical protein OROHE_013173 [Orobanche hederae]
MGCINPILYYTSTSFGTAQSTFTPLPPFQPAAMDEDLNSLVLGIKRQRQYSACNKWRSEGWRGRWRSAANWGAEGGVGGNQQHLCCPNSIYTTTRLVFQGFRSCSITGWGLMISKRRSHQNPYIGCASYTGLEIEYPTIEEIKNIITPPNPLEAANYLALCAKEKELLIFQEQSMPERFSIEVGI